MNSLMGAIDALITKVSMHRGYSWAILTGYALVAANMGAQFALTPVYLDRIGHSQFGMLMMLLNLINFVSLGIGWMSGGLTRVLGERAATNDHRGLEQAITLGKAILVIYALVVALAGIVTWLVLYPGQQLPLWVVLTAIYLIATYESNPERLLYVALKRQAEGNGYEIVRVVVFVAVTLILLPNYASLDVVLIAYLLGVLTQRGLMAIGLRKYHLRFWRRPDKEALPLLKRLAGRQGAQYLIYGAIVLLLQADVLIIGMISGADAAAKLVVLWKIPEALSIILWRIPSAIEPYLIHMDAKGDKDGIRKSFRDGRPRFLLITGVVAVAYAFGGQFVTGLWVGEYAPQDPWLYWMAAAAFFLITITRWPVSFAYALIRLRPLIAIAAIELIAKLGLIFFLLPTFSYAAPVAATALVHVALVGWAYQIVLRVR